jgi:hypothetical protein
VEAALALGFFFGDLDPRDDRSRWALTCPRDETRDGVGVTFGDEFDRPVMTVDGRAGDTEPRSLPFRTGTEPHALHATVDDDPAPRDSGHSLRT